MLSYFRKNVNLYIFISKSYPLSSVINLNMLITILKLIRKVELKDGFFLSPSKNKANWKWRSFYDNVMSVNSDEIKRPLFEEINLNYNSYLLLLWTRVWIWFMIPKCHKKEATGCFKNNKMVRHVICAFDFIRACQLVSLMNLIY